MKAVSFVRREAYDRARRTRWSAEGSDHRSGHSGASGRTKGARARASAARSDHKLSPTNVGNYHDFFHTEHTNERRTVAPKLH